MIYLDNAATTKMAPEVIDEMKECFEKFYNPSSNYSGSFETKKIIDKARAEIANLISAKPSEIIFTSGGSEGDNFAIKGLADANKDKGRHIVTSAIEHKAVLNTTSFLEDHGYEVSYVQPDSRGFLHISDIEKAIREDTVLVTIMMANNEIGTIQPVSEISALCKDRGILFHTDAVQAFGHMPIDATNLNVDAFTVSAHKFHGPKGVGFMFLRDGTRISPLIHGGGQERNLRGGTENILGIVGTAVAARHSLTDFDVKYNYMLGLRDHFIESALKIKGATLNGSLLNRLCNNVNLTFKNVPGESALAMLDMYGICASSGSACNSKDNTPSHVLTAIGLAPEDARCTLRFTLSEDNTIDEVDRTAITLKRIVEDLRSVYG